LTIMQVSPTPTKHSFAGFQPANTTPVPDILFDELLAVLGGSELKVLLYIIRRTLGFKKTCDAISFTQFEDGIKTKDGKILDLGCGLSRETISSALQSLEERGCIESHKRKGGVTTYSIRFKSGVPVGESDQSEKPTSKVVKNSDQSEKPTSELVGKTESTGRKNRQKLVGKSDTQVTVQETVLQETDNVRTNEPSVSPLSQENKVTLSLDEQQIFDWLKELREELQHEMTIVLPTKAGSITKANLGEIVASKIATKARLHNLCSYTSDHPCGDDHRIFVGNLKHRLPDWLRDTQNTTKEPEIEPAPNTDVPPTVSRPQRRRTAMIPGIANDLAEQIMTTMPDAHVEIRSWNGALQRVYLANGDEWVEFANPREWREWHAEQMQVAV
jgi:hypothetical protein